jgi:LemA protein
VEVRRVDVAFAELMLLAARHPALEADPRFRDLRREIAAAQGRIALERRRYNEQVALRNERIRRLPWRFFAAGRKPRAFYDPPADPSFDPAPDAGA